MILPEMVLVCPCEFVKSLSGVPKLPKYEYIRKCSQIFVFKNNSSHGKHQAALTPWWWTLQGVMTPWW
jgi:hypothetical protein